MIKIEQIQPPLKLPGLSSFTVSFDYDKRLVDAIKQVPNAIWHQKQSVWEIPLTSLSSAITLLTNYDDVEVKLLYDDVIFIGLDIDREILYKNINKRVDLMFENGLKEEVDELFNKFDKSLRAFQAIGYKEFLLSDDIEFVKEKIKLNTRRYAKRQFTFFKHQFDNVNWFKTKDEALNFALGEENVNRR